MKLMITGEKRHGKDYAAEYFKYTFDMTYEGSSMLCAKIFIFDELKSKYNYSTLKECFDDRVNHRAEWFDLIAGYNRDDLTALASKIFEHSNCYVGIRKYEELQACRNRWPEMLVLWVDRSNKLPGEDPDSCTITKEQADIVVHNNGTLEEYIDKLYRLGNVLFN